MIKDRWELGKHQSSRNLIDIGGPRFFSRIREGGLLGGEIPPIWYYTPTTVKLGHLKAKTWVCVKFLKMPMLVEEEEIQ